MFRRMALMVLLLCVALPAYARVKAQGWCMDGNYTVSVPGSSPSTSKYQRSFTSCTTTVYLAGTTTLATIYSTNTGTSKANPFTAATSGQWFFYADAGRYDVKLSGGGIPSPFTLGDLWLTETNLSVPISSFGGADIGAQINAANTWLGGSVGEIRVDKTGTISTAVTLSANRDLTFMPGTWNVATGAGTSGILCDETNKISGAGWITILKATGTMKDMLNCQDVARVTLENIAFEANGQSLTSVVNLSRSPEGPMEHRVINVRIDCQAQTGISGYALNMNGVEDGVLSASLIENCTGSFPIGVQYAKALGWNVTTGAAEINSTAIYGVAEIAGQNFSIHGGLIQGLRIIGNSWAISIAGSQITPLPDTCNIIEVGTGALLIHMAISGVYFIADKQAPCATQNVINTAGTGKVEIGVNIYDSYINDSGVATNVIGSAYTSNSASPNQSTVTLMNLGGGGSVVINAPAVTVANIIKVGYAPGLTRGNMSTTNSVVGLNIQATSNVATGATPATLGAIRMSNQDIIYGRNAANNANVAMIQMNAVDEIEMGPLGADTRFSGAIRIGAGGIVIDSAGYKSTRLASNSTAASAGALVDTTWTFTSAFADTNYTATCTIDTPTNFPYVMYTKTRAAGSVVITIASLQASAASGVLNCIAIHD